MQYLENSQNFYWIVLLHKNIMGGNLKCKMVDPNFDNSHSKTLLHNTYAVPKTSFSLTTHFRDIGRHGIDISVSPEDSFYF